MRSRWFGVVLLLPATLLGVVPEKSSEGIWSVPTASFVLEEFQPSAEMSPDLRLWSNGQARLSVVADATNVKGAAFRAETDGTLLSVIVDHTCELEDTILEFEYRLPEKAPVKTIGASVRVKEWEGKLCGIQLVPTRGAWRKESFPLSRLMQGDRWRLGGAKTVSRLEVGLIGLSSGLRIDFAWIRLVRRPTAFSPLVRPEKLLGGGMFARHFSVGSTVEKAWAMVATTNAFSLKVNGKVVGAGPKSAAADGWATRGMLEPAADQWSLDGFLSDGVNDVSVEVVGGEDAETLVALGWVAEGRRHVIVSDAAWMCESQLARTRSLADSERPEQIDIYPLRGADAWCRAAKRPNYARLLSYTPTNALLQVNPEKGKWGTDQAKSGRWFMKTPSGKPFFYYGIQTINCFWANIGYANWARRAYPNEEAWAEDAIELVHRLGFNGVGVAATAQCAFRSAAKRGMVVLENIGCGERGPALVNAQGNRQWGICDPFDPEFETVLRRRLSERAERWKDRPDIFAICVGNEALIEGNILDRPSSGYVYSQACGKEFVRWLEERYGHDIMKLNAAWFGSLESKFLKNFEEILVRRLDPYKDVPRVDDPEYAAAMAHLGKLRQKDKGEKSQIKVDFDMFAVHVVGTYARLVLACMREYFPDKLIVSNRFMGGATREMYACWKDYDLIAVNTYPLDTWGDAVFNAHKVRLLRDAHVATGRPVLLTEWGVQGLDVNLKSPAAQLYTQEERGRGYEKVLRQVVETMPFVAGVVDFGFQHLADSEGQGWGIVDNQGHPYHDYITGMVSAARWLDGWLK